MCNEVQGKDKIFIAKWDSLYKHVGKKKANKNFITNLPSFMGSYKNCMNFVLWLIWMILYVFNILKIQIDDYYFWMTYMNVHV